MRISLLKVVNGKETAESISFLHEGDEY